MVRVLPSDSLSYNFEINFPHPAIGREVYNFNFSTKNYIEEIAKAIKEYISIQIPTNIGDFLAKMKTLRTQMPKGKARMEYFKSLVDEYFQKNFKNWFISSLL